MSDSNQMFGKSSGDTPDFYSLKQGFIEYDFLTKEFYNNREKVTYLIC